MKNLSECSAVEQNPLKMSGVWVFRGTLVPVTALFENLEDGPQNRGIYILFFYFSYVRNVY